jgi:hypothetical protein
MDDTLIAERVNFFETKLVEMVDDKFWIIVEPLGSLQPAHRAVISPMQELGIFD